MRIPSVTCWAYAPLGRSCSASRSLAGRCGGNPTSSTKDAYSMSSTRMSWASRLILRPSPSSPRRSSRRETVQVRAVRPARDALEICFPRVAGYRVELPEERLEAEFNKDSVLELTPDLVGPSITRNQGIIGEGVDLSLVHTNDLLTSTLLFHLPSGCSTQVPRSGRRAQALSLRAT